jgi:hypothetical protein
MRVVVTDTETNVSAQIDFEVAVVAFNATMPGSSLRPHTLVA